MPQYPSCDGSPGSPGLTKFGKLLRCGTSLQTLHCLGGNRQGEISRWPDVRTAKHHQQIDVGSPMANSLDLEKLNFDRSIIHRVKRFQIETSLKNLARKVSAVCCFLTAEADCFQGYIVQLEESTRGERGRDFEQLCMSGFRRSKRDLLLEDDVKES